MHVGQKTHPFLDLLDDGLNPDLVQFMALLVQEDVPVPEEPVFFLGSVIPLLEVLSDDLCAIGVHLLGARFLAPRISVPPQPLAPVHLGNSRLRSGQRPIPLLAPPRNRHLP